MWKGLDNCLGFTMCICYAMYAWSLLSHGGFIVCLSYQPEAPSAGRITEVLSHLILVGCHHLLILVGDFTQWLGLACD